MSWRGGAMLVLLLAAAVLGWAVWTQRERKVDAGVAAARPDYVLQDFELVALNKQGGEAFTLRAPTLRRDPDERTLEIDTPLFTIPPAAGGNRAPWEVRSKTGWVSAAGDELRLRGDVRATSRDAAGPIALTGSELNVFPDAQRATSAAPVTVTRPGSILNGRDLEVRLDSKQYRLSEVRHRYVPRR